MSKKQDVTFTSFHDCFLSGNKTCMTCGSVKELLCKQCQQASLRSEVTHDDCIICLDETFCISDVLHKNPNQFAKFLLEVLTVCKKYAVCKNHEKTFKEEDHLQQIIEETSETVGDNVETFV